MKQRTVRILVADDFEPWRRSVSSLLQQKPGWHVVSEASDGLEAVQKAQELRPDVILLDIGLPKLNGIEAARQIRNLAPNSKILFASTHDDLDFVEEALTAGARGYVVKANAGSELVRAVKAVLQGKRFVSSTIKRHTPNSVHLEDTQAPAGLRSDSAVLAPARGVPRNMEVTRRHEVLFYSDDAYFLDSSAHLIEAALKAGNAAIFLATESHRDALLARLQAQGLDVSAAIQQGRYISVDAADLLARFMVNGRLDPDRFLKVVGSLFASAANAAKEAPPRVALCGECAPLLWAQGKPEEAIRVEQLCDKLAETHGVEVLCGYPSRSLDSEEDSHIFRRICAGHSAVYSQ